MTLGVRNIICSYRPVKSVKYRPSFPVCNLHEQTECFSALRKNKTSCGRWLVETSEHMRCACAFDLLLFVSLRRSTFFFNILWCNLQPATQHTFCELWKICLHCWLLTNLLLSHTYQLRCDSFLQKQTRIMEDRNEKAVSKIILFCFFLENKLFHIIY